MILLNPSPIQSYISRPPITNSVLLNFARSDFVQHKKLAESTINYGLANLPIYIDVSTFKAANQVCSIADSMSCDISVIVLFTYPSFSFDYFIYVLRDSNC
jgi:hypothetical protein